MVDKSNFTPDEWKLLLESVMMAGHRSHRSRPKRIVGTPEGGFCEQQRTREGKDGPWGKPAHQGSCLRF